ncbi:ESPR-type extended signal peptide-containing protein [Caballeronia cordobensis]|uniref:ESPR-type extended signal peptide-containing protein n=1 Tax=Caballeronia cordobensis TaxID=1353886 RepID=UPI00045EE839|nr:YadA domain-containing protein [Burkholderia sp. RPE67]
MNKTYRSVWNASTSTWVAAAETAKARGKGSRALAERSVAMALAASIAFAALPSAALGGGVGVGTDQALGENSVAVGNNAKAHRSDAVAIGANAEAMGKRAIAAGAGAKAHGDDSVAAGAGSAATSPYSVAIGPNARAERDSAIALGNLAAVMGSESIALGARATVQRDNAIAIGNDASVLVANSVALGPYSVANGQGLNQQAWLTGGTAKGEVSVGAAGSERRITNLAAGAQDTDAVNVAQLRKAAGGASGSADAVLYDTPAHARITLGGAAASAPVSVSNVAAGAVGAGSTDAVNGAQLHGVKTLVDSHSTSLATLQSNVTNMANGGGLRYFRANDGGGAVLGEAVSDAAAAGAGSLAAGPGASANGLASSALGWKARADGTGSVALGTGATGERPNGARGGWSTAIGSNAYAARERSTAIGADARALAENGVALGTNAEASHGGSVALGAHAVANGATLGHDAYLVGGAASGEVSVGSSGSARRITNLAAGAEDRDAVNVAQLKALDAGIRNHAVMYDDAAKQSVTFGGEGGTRLKNVADAADAGDAVNLSQLRSVQRDALSWNDNLGAYDASHGTAGATHRIANVAAGALPDDAVNLAQLNALGSGLRDGAVMYDRNASGAPDYGRATLRGLGGTAIDNVAPGVISSNSLYAVNGSQLHAMAASVGQSLGGGAGVAQDGTWRAPSYVIGKATYSNVGDALTGIDGRVTNIEGSVSSIHQQISTGEIGLVRQDAQSGAITVAAERNGTTVDLTGQDGARQLTGVANGEVSASSTDAVNGSQIYALSREMGAVNLNMTAHAQTMQDMATQTNAYTDQRVSAALESANSYADKLVGSARSDASGGTAAAMALAGLPQSVQYGRNLVGVAGATYDGQSAVAVGLSRVSGTGRWVFKGSASTNTRGYYGVAVGAGRHW